jgi:hypothetical protein
MLSQEAGTVIKDPEYRRTLSLFERDRGAAHSNAFGIRPADGLQPEMAMARGSDAPLKLAEFLTELQAELSDVVSQSEGRDVGFRVDGVTVDLDVSWSLGTSREGTVKPEFAVESVARHANEAAGTANDHRRHLTVHFSRLPAIADASDDVVGPALLPPPSLPPSK